MKPYDMAFGGNTGGSSTYVTTFVAHPLTKDVSDLLFYGGNVITAGGDAGAEAGPPVNYGTMGASVAGTARTYGLGRVAVYGDDWIVFNSQINRLGDGGVDAGPSDGGLYGPTTPTRQFWHNVLMWTSGRL